MRKENHTHVYSQLFNIQHHHTLPVSPSHTSAGNLQHPTPSRLTSQSIPHICRQFKTSNIITPYQSVHLTHLQAIYNIQSVHPTHLQAIYNIQHHHTLPVSLSHASTGNLQHPTSSHPTSQSIPHIYRQFTTYNIIAPYQSVHPTHLQAIYNIQHHHTFPVSPFHTSTGNLQHPVSPSHTSAGNLQHPTSSHLTSQSIPHICRQFTTFNIITSYQSVHPTHQQAIYNTQHHHIVPVSPSHTSTRILQQKHTVRLHNHSKRKRKKKAWTARGSDGLVVDYTKIQHVFHLLTEQVCF